MDSPTLRRPAPPPGFSYDAPDASAPASAGSQPSAAASPSFTRPAPPPGFSYGDEAPATPTLQPPQGRSWARAAGDLGVGLGEGLVSAGMFIPQLANTVTGGAVDRYLFKPATAAVDRMLGGPGEGSTLAQASQDTRAALDQLKSPELRQQEQDLADTKGFLPSAKAILTHPALLSQQVAEQVPQFIAPGGIVRKAGAVAFERAAGEALAKGAAKRVAAGMTEDAAQAAATKAAERVGQRAALKAGAKAAVASEAAISGSQNSEQAQQQVLGMDEATLAQNPDYQAAIAGGATPQQAREQLAMQAGERAAAAGAAITAATGGLTAGLESRIFQGETGVHGLGALLTRDGAKEAAKAVGKEFTQEVLQEGGEQLGQNYGVQSVDPNQSLLDQVPEQAALGGVIGGVMGGGAFAGSAALESRLKRPRFAGAAPGSLSDAANAVEAASGPLGRAANAAAPGPAPIEAAAAPAAAAAASPAAAAAPTAPRSAPIAPPWIAATTGAITPPSKAALTATLAQQIIRQYDEAGHMRINTAELANAWGVDKNDVSRARSAATQMANQAIRGRAQTGGADQATAEPAAAPAPDATAASEPGTTASIPLFITQPMKRELRALGHTDADIAKMTPQQAHDVLRAGEPLLQGARDLTGQPGGAAVDQAVADQQQPNTDTAATAQPQESGNATDRTGSPEAAAPAGTGAAPASAADAQPAADAATGGARGTEEPGAAVRADLASSGTDANAQHALKTWDNLAPGDQVKLYRGESAQNEAGGEWWTTDKAKAERFGKVQSVTLPAEVVAKHAARGHNGADEFVFPSTRPPALEATKPPAKNNQNDNRATKTPPTGGVSASGGPFKVSGAARDAEGLRVKTADGETNGRTHVDKLVAKGYTKVESTRAGDKMVHALVNDAGDREPIKARQLKYAKEATASAAAPAVKDSLTDGQKRTAELLGANVGDTVRTTGDGADIQAGSTWKIERIDPDGTVHISSPSGGTGSFKRSELEREVRKGATFQKESAQQSEAKSQAVVSKVRALGDRVRSQDAEKASAQPAAGKAATELERREVPQYNPMRPAETITKHLYRETNAEGAAELLDGMKRHAGLALNTIYAASHEHLAKGQGTNRGVAIELNPAAFDGKLNLDKPASEQLIKSAGEAELEVVPKAKTDAPQLRSVTLKRGWKKDQSAAFANRVLLRLRQLQANGWTKETTEEGIVFKATGEAAAAEPAQATRTESTSNAAPAENGAVSPIDAAAHEAATSPTNDKPEPTQAQKEAGNYAKGHVSLHGLDISIENPRGSERTGVDPNGKAWAHTMSDHYGYVRRTTGADGEQVDVYIGPKPESEKVFVVDQIDQKTGAFDEHKAMLGFTSEKKAVKAYRSNFDKGWKVGPVHAMSMDDFKDWLKNGDTSKPAAEREQAAGAPPATAAEATTTEPSAATNTGDAGAELWYNRRNRTGNGVQWSDLEGLNDTLKVKEAVKSKVWPRPDYEQLVADGLRPEFAHLVKQVYDALPTKPQTRGVPTDEQLRLYIDTMGKIREAVFDYVRDGERVGATLQSILARAKQLSGDRISMIDLARRPENTRSILDAVFPGEGKARWRNPDGSSKEANAAANLLGGNKLMKALQIGEDEFAAAIKAVQGGWPAKQPAWKKLYTISVRNGTYTVVRAGRRIATGLATRDEADTAAQAHYQENKKTGSVMAEESQSVEQSKRVGPDHRAPGENVSSDQLREAFGFRGVNFGNWMKGESAATVRERQLHLNHAYDAFMDLADITGLPPRALSLNGQIGLAFGAQGKGGRGTAHFIPGVNEINLTRRTGAGAIAHEWAHALDHYFAVQSGEDHARATRPYLTLLSKSQRAKLGVRPEISHAFQKIINAMEKRPLSAEEVKAREERVLTRSADALNATLAPAREALEKAAGADAVAEFDGLAERLRDGDAGEGKVETGRKVPSLRNRRQKVPEIIGQTAGQMVVLLRNHGVDADAALSAVADADQVAAAIAYQKQAAEQRASQPKPDEITSNYLTEARRLESDSAKRGQAEAYWSTPWEMFARAFQSYAIDNLASGGRQNDYLSRRQASEESVKALREAGLLDGDMFPRAAERARIGEAFATLFNAIKTEPSENGNVRLFSFAGERAQTADRRALEQAQQMESMGRDSVPDRHGNQPGSPEDTHMATGWHRGVDGKWRFEIDDSAAKLMPAALKDRAVKYAMVQDLVNRRQAAMDAGDTATAQKLQERIRQANVAYEDAKTLRMDQVLDHPALYAAYPDLASVAVRVDGGMKSWGSFNPNTDAISIRNPSAYPASGSRSLKSVLLHEIQHAIQKHEGFARGGSAAEARTLPEFEQLLKQYMAEHEDRLPSWTEVVPGPEQLEEAAAHKVYLRLAGEVEARNTQRRAGMSAEERRAIPASETADVARADQIVRFNGGTAMDEGAPRVTEEQRAHARQLQGVVDRVRAQWKGEDVPGVQVVATPEQLPASAKVDEVGNPDASYQNAAGFYDGKKIYIVASAHDGEAGVRKALVTMAHEAVGHYGIDRIVKRELGADAWQKITAATERLRASPAQASPAMREVLASVKSRYGAVDADTHARETLAVMAERGVRNGLLDRAVAAIRQWLRRMMPSLRLGESELRQLLVKSAQYLERGPSYAQRVQAQAAMSFSRDGWSPDFPDAVTAHPHGVISNHPDYAAAKAGDRAAALRLARDVVTPEFVDRVRAALPEGAKPIIVPVVATEASGDNEIPRMAAEVLAQRLGAEADTDILQATKVSRGGSDAMHRLANQPTFDGAVQAGRDYVLLDDTLAQGGTLAQLKTHIERGGGNVVLATALTAKDYSRKLALDPDMLRKVRGRYGSIEGWWKQQFGYGFDGLTQSEARAILTYDKGRLSPDGLRNRVAAGKIEGIGRVGTPATGDRPGTEAPGPGPKRDFSLDENADPDVTARRNKNFENASASIEAISEQLPKLDATPLQKVKEWLSGKARDVEPTALGALQLRHVLELASDTAVLEKPAKAYSDLFQRMDGDRNTLTQEGAAKVDSLVAWARERGAAGWAGKIKPEAKALFKFMHAVTQLGVDPTSEYQRLTVRDSRGEEMPWTKELIKERIQAIRGQMRGRPGDDKRAMMDEINDLKRLPAREKARQLKYPELVAAWNALTPEARNQFVTMRDHYRQQSEALEQATIDHIQSLDIPAQSKRAAADLVRRNFADAKVSGVYFPLMRFGDYWISAHTGDGEYVFAKYESAAEQERAAKQLVAAGATIEATGRQDNNYRSKDAPSGTFMGDLMGVLRAAKAPEQVQDQIYQMYLKTLPELSLKKRGIHRKNIAGYTDDVPRAFASSVFHGAHQLSKARYGWQLQNTLEHMRGTVEARRGGMSPSEAAHTDALMGEINRRHDWILNPTNSKLSNAITSVGFAYFLSASPASALVNLIQVPQIVLPVLGAQHGWSSATRVLTKTMRDAFRTGGNIDRVLTGEDLQAFKALQQQGTFQRTATHSLAGIAEGDSLRANPVYTRVLNAVSWMFHTSEVINREGTGIAAFRLAREKGMGFNEAVKYADEITNGTHGDYSNANRARYMQGNVAKVLLQFKNYSLAMSWLWGRQFYKAFKGESPEVRSTARRTLTGLLGMTGIFAGVVGMPIFNALRYAAQAVHAASGDDDKPWDFMTEFRSWLAEHLGEEAAAVIADGPVSQLGANVASRVSMSDLWFRDADRQLEGEDAYNNMLQSLAGPTGGLLRNLYVGAQQFNEGHTWRGIETMLPSAAKNAMKAVRYAHEGVNTLRGDPIVPDVSAPEELVQALGFQPTRIAQQQRVNNALYNYQQFIQDRRQNLLNAFAMALQSGDNDGRADVLQRIQSFNASYPEIAIRPGTLRASLRTRAQRSAQSDNGIMLNKKIAGRVRQEVGAIAD